jgi:serine/threonine protein kinase
MDAGSVLCARSRWRPTSSSFDLTCERRSNFLSADVAVKFLSDEVAHDESVRERFLREARALAKLRSPHVVRVHDYGVHEGQPYLVMEYLQGENLEQHIDRVGRLSPCQTAAICRGVAKALQEAHDRGIVHRDVKCGNIFLARDAGKTVVKLVDFGLVLRAQEGAEPDLTRVGAMLGTAGYMSPEQFRDCRRVDHRTDLWALGVVCYECLTGCAPFQARNLPMLAVAICDGPTPRPSAVCGLPEGVDAWFERALCRDREGRFQSAEEMARTMASWAAPPSSLAPHSESIRPEASATQAPPARTLFAAAVVVIALVALGLGGARWQSGVHPSEAGAVGFGMVAHEVRSATAVGTGDASTVAHVLALPPPTAPENVEEAPEPSPNPKRGVTLSTAAERHARLDAGRDAESSEIARVDPDPWESFRSRY